MGWCACVLVFCAPATAWALDLAVPVVDANALWSHGFNGAGVEIGVIDAYLADSTHPAISGNYLGGVKFAGGPSVVGSHATEVAGAAASQDATYSGVAPGAGWWTAQTARINGTTTVRDQTVAAETFGQGLDDLSGNPVEVITMSIGIGGDSTGADQWSLALDHIAHANGRTITVSAGNDGPSGWTIGGPPSGAYNAIIVGATGAGGSGENYDYVASYSSRGPSDDGRAKPDIVAPGTMIHMPTLSGGWADASGTSFATPMVAGGAALLIDMGQELGHSTDPKVVKSVLLNSAEKLSGWSHTTTRPLDVNQGAGQMHLRKAYGQYLLAEQGPGTVKSVGWDAGQAAWDAEQLYAIDVVVPAGEVFSAMLNWDRIVTTNTEDINTATYSLDHLDNLDLFLYEANDLTTPVASSVSTIDNVEHIYYTMAQTGHYVLGVKMTGASSGDAEDFGLSWHVLHDPTSVLLAGDADVDGDVDFDDFITLQIGWSAAQPTWLDGDFDGDGDVDFDDFLTMQLYWTGAAAIPEPGSFCLVILGAVTLIRRRARGLGVGGREGRLQR